MTAVPGRMQLVRYAEDDVESFFRSVAIEAALRMGQPKSVARSIATGEAFAAVTSLKHRSWNYEKEVRIVYNQRHDRPDSNEILRTTQV